MIIVEKFIPVVIKTGNKVGGGHWSLKYGYRNKIFKAIQWYFVGNDKPKRVERIRVRIKITRVMKKGQRAFDEDNLAWGVKPVIDFLKQSGWIYEDSPLWLDRVYRQVRSVDIGMRQEDYGLTIRLEYPDGCYL
jgi:hypothetical protein